MSDHFPPDEFDEIAQRGGPVGVHRAPRPWWSKLVAPILVFVLAGAVAFLIANYLWNQTVHNPEDPTPTISETVTATITPDPNGSPTPNVTASETPDPTPSQTVSFSANVAVLNGSGISGLAAKNEKTLEAAGFTTVSASNLTGGKPSSNVVVYAQAELEATAKEIAKQLGISDISLDVTRTDADIEVHLVSDNTK